MNYKVTYTDELAYYDRMEQNLMMQEIEEEIINNEMQRIVRLELQAQARILEELDRRQTESGESWLSCWIDIKTEINQLLRKVSN